MAQTEINTQKKVEQTTFGAGCFWCVAAVFEGLDGAIDVRQVMPAAVLQIPHMKIYVLVLLDMQKSFKSNIILSLLAMRNY